MKSAGWSYVGLWGSPWGGRRSRAATSGQSLADMTRSDDVVGRVTYFGASTSRECCLNVVLTTGRNGRRGADSKRSTQIRVHGDSPCQWGLTIKLLAISHVASPSTAPRARGRRSDFADSTTVARRAAGVCRARHRRRRRTRATDPTRREGPVDAPAGVDAPDGVPGRGPRRHSRAPSRHLSKHIAPGSRPWSRI